MSGYFSRGASAGGPDEGYFNREDVTGPAGVGSATGGPGGIADENLGEGLLEQQGVVEKEGIEYDPKNPYIARAIPQEGGERLDETAGTNSPMRADESYRQIIEGSDSERTGTSWDLPAREDAPTVSTPHGEMPEDEGQGEASPNRNTGEVTQRDRLDDVGAWGTMGTSGSPGSPTGNS